MSLSDNIWAVVVVAAVVIVVVVVVLLPGPDSEEHTLGRLVCLPQ